MTCYLKPETKKMPCLSRHDNNNGLIMEYLSMCGLNYLEDKYFLVLNNNATCLHNSWYFVILDW